MLAEVNRASQEQSLLIDKLLELSDRLLQADDPEDSRQISQEMEKLHALFKEADRRCRLANAQLIEQLALEAGQDGDDS